MAEQTAAGSIIFDSNLSDAIDAIDAGGHWLEEAGPVKREGFPNFKNKPTHYASWNEPQDANPYIMRTYSFAEFKDFETYPDKCQVYAYKDLKAEIIKFAENLGYTVSSEVPRSDYASILEFTMGDEPQYISIEDLINKYFTSQNMKYNIFDIRSVSEVLTSQFVEVAKLVRTLTIAEYKGDGCYEAEPNNIKLPKDFTI